MHTKCLIALQSSLKGIAPKDGIAYLLYRVGSHYWIPIATSNKALDDILYYRFGYALELNIAAKSKIQLIHNDIVEVVKRGKIESLIFDSTFYQEVSLLGDDGSASLAIVKAAPSNIFDPFSRDASKGMHPLIDLVHDLWGTHSSSSFTDEGVSVVKPTQAVIVQKATELLSDKLRFPPYFLLTDYVLSIYASVGSQEQHICSNPLGWSYWIYKHLAGNPPPWIKAMAERKESYYEDLCCPLVSKKQKSKYKKALKKGDELANQLADRLRDDVALVAWAGKDFTSNDTIMFWARHNRPKGANQLNFATPYACRSVSEALRHLLNEKYQEGDFLITLWATWYDKNQKNWKTIHVGCDTSHKLQSFSLGIDDTKWPSMVQPPESSKETYPRIEIRFRPTDSSFEETEIEVRKVLVYSERHIKNLDHKAAIRFFWGKVQKSVEFYKKEIFTTGGRHEMWWWKSSSATLALENELSKQVISDIQSIAHFTAWNGIKKYDPAFKDGYIHLARSFRELDIAAELVEYVFGKAQPTKREHLDFIKCGKDNISDLLVAFWLLRETHWKIKSAYSEKQRFVLELELETEKGAALEVAKNCFDDIENPGDAKELLSACTWLRRCAVVFSVLVAGGDYNRVCLRCEFNGGQKTSKQVSLTLPSPND